MEQKEKHQSLKDKIQELIRERDQYQNILANIEDGYYECNLRGDLTYASDAICKIWGYSREEMIGKNYRDFYDEETANKGFHIHNKVYNTGVSDYIYDLHMVTKDGKKKVLENSVSLHIDSTGNLIGFRGIARDVTERTRNEEELARHRIRLDAIFSSVQEAIITVDTGLKVIEANNSMVQICSIDVSDTVGQVFPECTSHCNQACHKVLRDVLKHKTPVNEHQIECVRQNQPKQTLIVTGTPLLDQGKSFSGAILVIRDVTRLTELERELQERKVFHNMIGKSKQMQSIYELIEGLNDIEATVLITGESGTGKELVAKALHNSGNRAFKPFVSVHCAALAENLLESELFGHTKGAFTGAIKDKQGRFQLAEGGTILLDEIGDISPSVQVKLLRVLQEKEFERVGDSTPIKADVRVIACTNANLAEKVKKGEFRKDLFYRLKVVEVEIPPLRKRLEDIPLLAEHFSNMFRKNYKKNVTKISDNRSSDVR